MITKKAKDSQKRMKMRCRKITEMGIQKSVKMQMGEVGVKISHDRNGEYKPKIIAKYDRNVDRMEEKSLGLYACGMSQRDIADQIKSLYDVEISPELVSEISEKIMPEVITWQNLPLGNL